MGGEEGPGDQATALRRGFELGRAAHGALGLAPEEYSRRVLALVEGRLRRAGVPVAAEGMAEALSRSDLADLYLAVACEAGTAGAWERFSGAYGRVIVALAVRRGASAAEAEELAGEIPGELFTPPPRGGARTRLGTYDGSGSLSGWLAVIVQRRLADRWRAASREPPPPRPPPPEPDPHAAAGDRETLARFEEAFREAWADFAPQEALALLLRYRDGLPQTEIARVLGVGEPRVSRVLSGASARIRVAILRRLGSLPVEGERDPARVLAALEGAVARILATLPPRNDSDGDG